MQARRLLGLLLWSWGSGWSAGASSTAPPAAATEAPAGSEEWAHRLAGAGRCKILFTSSYGYRQFFPLGDAASRSGGNPMDGYPAPPVPPTLSGTPNATVSPSVSPASQASAKRLLLQFQVMAESDAHILISAQRRSDREAYEVVLGAGANSYTDFRRLPASIPPRRAFNYSTGVVSGSELRAFWLLADLATGLLAVGPVGGAPILSWVDPDPVQVRYFSLCTWTDVLGTWLYGCDEAASEPLDAEEMPPAERVFQNIVTPAKLRPPPRAPVDTHLLVNHLTMDDRKGVASLYGTFRMEWRDERLSWAPSNFSGLNLTHLSPSDVWIPGLQILDPIGRSDPLAGAGAERLELRASGNLSCQLGVRLRARCVLHSSSECTCTLRLGARPPAQLHHLTFALQLQQPMQSDWAGEAGRLEERGEQVLQLQLRARHRASRRSCMFLAAYIASCLCCVPWAVLGLLSAPLKLGAVLLGAVSVFFQAVSLLCLHAALPPAVVTTEPAGLLCLSGSLVAAVSGLLLPRLVKVLAESGARLPRALRRCLRSGLLHGITPAAADQRWRESPSTAEQALEMLEAMDSEQAARDWSALSAVLHAALSLTCLTLTAAAGIIAIKL